MYVWDDTTAGNGSFDERVQLFVTADGQLKMSWGDALDFEILTGVTSQLKHLGGEVLEDGGRVDGCGGSDASVRGCPRLEVTVDTTHWELESSLCGSRHGLRLGLS